MPPSVAQGSDGHASRVHVYNLRMTGLSDAVREVANYAQHLPGNVERFCEYWSRGY